MQKYRQSCGEIVLEIVERYPEKDADDFQPHFHPSKKKEHITMRRSRVLQTTISGTAYNIKDMALVLHPARFLKVWNKENPLVKCTLRLPASFMNETLIFRVLLEGRTITARSEGE